NSGIGLATARLFVDEGARVVITGRNKETLISAARELGTDAWPVPADVTDFEATRSAVSAALARFGALDIVFANAGIGMPTPIGETSPEAFENVLRTNVTAAFLTVQAALPHMEPGSSVVLNGSVHAVLGAPGYSAY